MKQHITKEQWDELSGEQKGEFVIKLQIAGEMNVTGVMPSIGQMMEYLGDDWLKRPNEYFCDALWKECVDKAREEVKEKSKDK